MTKQQIYQEIEETLGLVPSFLKEIPDSQIEFEWKPSRSWPINASHSFIAPQYSWIVGSSELEGG